MLCVFLTFSLFKVIKCLCIIICNSFLYQILLYLSLKVIEKEKYAPCHDTEKTTGKTGTTKDSPTVNTLQSVANHEY